MEFDDEKKIITPIYPYSLQSSFIVHKTSFKFPTHKISSRFQCIHILMCVGFAFNEAQSLFDYIKPEFLKKREKKHVFFPPRKKIHVFFL